MAYRTKIAENRLHQRYRETPLQSQQGTQVAWSTSMHAEVFAESPIVMPITYYRNQAVYDECGRDAGPYGQANAASRAIASELERMGIQVEFRYADSADA